MAQPLARDVAEEIAKLYGVCIRPVALRRLDMTTGKSEAGSIVVVGGCCGFDGSDVSMGTPGAGV
ncbi:hypothetical protein [Nonomuraea helvata]